MAKITGGKSLVKHLDIQARGKDVTAVLLKSAERVRQEYVEKIQERSPGRSETRYSPRREVVVSAPGEAPNTDTGDLVGTTGVKSDKRNEAETFVTSDHAVALEYGTNKMAARPALRPAYAEKKEAILSDLRAALKEDLRG